MIELFVLHEDEEYHLWDQFGHDTIQNWEKISMKRLPSFLVLRTYRGY